MKRVFICLCLCFFCTLSAWVTLDNNCPFFEFLDAFVVFDENKVVVNVHELYDLIQENSIVVQKDFFKDLCFDIMDFLLSHPDDCVRAEEFLCLLENIMQEYDCDFVNLQVRAPRPHDSVKDESRKDLLVARDMSVVRNLHVGGSSDIQGDFKVGGAFDTQDDLVVAKDLRIGQNLYVEGSSDVLGDFRMTGSFDIEDDLVAGQDVRVARNLYVTGSSDVQGDFRVGGVFDAEDATFSNDLQVTGNAIIYGGVDLGVQAPRGYRSPTTRTNVDGYLNVAGPMRAYSSSDFNGPVSLTYLLNPGIIHNDSLGLLSTRLVTNADIDNAAAIVDTKLATISSAGKVSNSATTATSDATASAIVARDGSGNFSAGTITADLIGSVSGAASRNVLKSGDHMTGGLSITSPGSDAFCVNTDKFVVDSDAGDTAIASKLTVAGQVMLTGVGAVGVLHSNASGALSSELITNVDIDNDAAIADTKLATISSAGKVSNSATTATSDTIAHAIVARDSSGDFSAGTIIADLTGSVTGAASQNVLRTGDTMTGDLNMGGHSISNINLVDGVDVPAHASRHNPGGADALALGEPVSVGTINQEGSAASFARSDHVHNHGNLAGGTLHALATDSFAGFMSAEDKFKLDNLDPGADFVLKAGDTMSGTLDITAPGSDAFIVNTNKFIIDSNTGNTVIDGDLLVRGETVLENFSVTYTGSTTFVDDVVLRPASGNALSLIFKEDDGLQEGRLSCYPDEDVKGLFMSIDGGVTKNLAVVDSGDVEVAQSLTVYDSTDLHGELVVDNGLGNPGLTVTGLTTLVSTGTALHVTGSAEKTVGGTTWINASDRRIKEDITDADIDTCLALVDKLFLRRYKYKDEWCVANNVSRDYEYGIIAQELEAILPQCVSTQAEYLLKDPQTGVVKEKLVNFKKINLDQVYKILIGALQCLHKKYREQNQELVRIKEYIGLD